MARSRNIKPGFFLNEELSELSFETRLLFIGLWTIADKEGRLEDRPKRIHISCLPYDQVNVDSMLNDLQSSGFIVRYSIEGKKYIQIINWLKHQAPHHKEVDSEIPKYAINHKDNHAQVKHDPSITQEQVNKNASCHTDSLNLIPDSGFSDSLNTAAPEKTKQEKIKCESEKLPDQNLVSQELWDSFLKIRQKAKAVNSTQAIKCLITELHKLRTQGHDPTEVVNQSIRSTWKDVYPLKNRLPTAEMTQGRDEFNRQQTEIARQKLFGNESQEKDITNEARTL